MTVDDERTSDRLPGTQPRLPVPHRGLSMHVWWAALPCLIAIGLVVRTAWNAPTIDADSPTREADALVAEKERVLRAQAHGVFEDDLQRVASARAIETIRSDLLKELWPTSHVPPIDLPTTIEINRSGAPRVDWPFQEVQYLAETHRLSIVDDSAATSEPFRNVAYYFRCPLKSRLNRIVLIHQGHGGLEANRTDVLATRLAICGFDLLYLNMPLIGENTGPPFPSPDGQHESLCGHEGMGGFATEQLNPLSLLLNQISTGLQQAEEINQAAYDDISMCGVSGGGYLTTLYASLDTRIKYSISISGTRPHLLRWRFDRAWEDDESQSIFSICPLHNMYVLASVADGHEREHYQFHSFGNLFGARDGRIAAYEDLIGDHVRQLDGTFEIIVDPDSTHHYISDLMQRRILEILGVRSPPIFPHAAHDDQNG